MSFFSDLENTSIRNNSLLCVGLDPDIAQMPDIGILNFNKAIIEATSDLVCCYKLNFAFYEAAGAEGWQILHDTLREIPGDIPAIADAKRADIGNTAKAYARAIFDGLGFSAATVNPYLGYDSLEPFINSPARGIFVLCRTSNPGSADFQELQVQFECELMPLYQAVAAKTSRWNRLGNLGLVVGATYPDELKTIRRRYPDVTLLIPGVGAQGADLEKAVRGSINDKGAGIIINASRQVLYASVGQDFAQAARQSAMKLRDEINRYRNL
jgi:orotidine-5'-phosphate decarboxylase